MPEARLLFRGEIDTKRREFAARLMKVGRLRDPNVKRAGPSFLRASRTPLLRRGKPASQKSKARAPASLIGICESRKTEGSAKNPPKGKFVEDVFFPALTGWAIFCHASGVGPGMHRLRENAVVVRLPGRPDEGSAKNPPKGNFVEGVLLVSRLPFVKALRVKSRRPTKLPNMSRLRFTKRLWVNTDGN
jgi:hypothetical protein